MHGRKRNRDVRKVSAKREDLDLGAQDESTSTFSRSSGVNEGGEKVRRAHQ